MDTISLQRPSDEEVALGANPRHRRILFNSDKRDDTSPNEITYQFFLDHDFYVLAHDSTTPVPLTETFTDATGPDDDRFKVWFKLPDEFIRVTKYGETCILICERL